MLKDIPPQLPVLTLPQQSDRRSTQQKTRPSSPSFSCLNVCIVTFNCLPSLLMQLLQADATGGDGLIEEVHDLYSNFFQVKILFLPKGADTDHKYLKSSQRSLPLPLSGFRLTPLFSARRLLHVFSRHCPPTDESVPKDRSKRRFFSRRTHSNASLDPAPVTPNQSVPERKVGECDGEQVDDVSAVSTLAHCHLNIVAVSVLPPTTRSAPQKIQANSTMILPPARRAQYLIVTCIAKTNEIS
jgi:hypothetical protein